MDYSKKLPLSYLSHNVLSVIVNECLVMTIINSNANNNNMPI